MLKIPLTELFAKMPVAELEQTPNDFLAPVTALSPAKRLRWIAPEAVCVE